MTVPAGAAIALHHHLGTQIARIASGTLTYSVRDGGVKIRSGQWIVEQPQTIHQAENRGDSKVVIYLATLLKHGAPPHPTSAEVARTRA